MAQISKYLISKEVYERVFDLLLKTISSLRTKGNTAKFLDGFITPTEKIMLSKRLAICILLAKGYSYREISGVLKVSLATIGTIGRNYKYHSGFHSVVQRVLEDEKNEDFWLKIGEAIASVGTVGGKGSSAWVDLKNKLRKKRLNKSF